MNDTNLPRVPHNVKFRVLIIGRANAGKTTILQRVCDTTQSPEIYRRDQRGHRRRVRSHVPSSTFNLIIYSDSTRPYHRGRTGLFLSMTADGDNHAYIARHA
jgi:GTPase Era involved in 16S rRNA processing